MMQWKMKSSGLFLYSTPPIHQSTNQVGLKDPKRALGVLDECPTAPGGGIIFFSQSPHGGSNSGGGGGSGVAGGGAGGSSSSGGGVVSSPVLRVEDLLPFFPDFVTIDDFKVCIHIFEKKRTRTHFNFEHTIFFFLCLLLIGFQFRFTSLQYKTTGQDRGESGGIRCDHRLAEKRNGRIHRKCKVSTSDPKKALHTAK